MVVFTSVSAGVLGLAFWEGLQAQNTRAAHYSVGALIILALATAVILGFRRQLSTSTSWARGACRALGRWQDRPAEVSGYLIWGLLILAIAGWDANSFAHQSHQLPTLSYYFGRVTRYHLGRTFVFLGWLSLGAYLVAGNRLHAE